MIITFMVVLAAALLIGAGLETLTLKIQILESEIESISVAHQADMRVAIDLVVPSASVDMVHDVAFDKDRLVLILLTSDRAVTLETNDGSSPDKTITLAAGVPFLWKLDSDIAVPFPSDVTKFYWTNASGGNATVRGEILWDATP